MKRTFAALAAPMVLAVTTPALAQDTSEAEMAAMGEAMGGIFGDVFNAEPLTVEQESRLPQAVLVVEKVFPEGTYAKMMDETIKPMMDGMMGGMADLPTAEIAQLTGSETWEVAELGKDKLRAATAIIDPAFDQRNKAMQTMTIDMVTNLMTEVEPSYRAGLARAYAKRFSASELTDLSDFFKTPTGAHYAAESMLIYTDPQVMSAMEEMMPAMMEMFPAMMTEIEEISSSIPEPRQFTELSAAEQNELSQLLGTSVEEMKKNAAEAAAEEEYEYEYEGASGTAEDAVVTTAE
ncbi:DUF2059 domain-containing protein [Altererythrobacter sp. ZODW24]|uniref:DUF2059 domain-containing protein n=1 Tax=Altererythrobacter sp. ZODW24 TaxID=2185142 RepID=UPI000DF7B8C9|nr:DUF2059 domain-containing protein [Altererythrobacter sp. ZODW24]